MANPFGLSDRAWWSGRPDASPEKRFTGTRSSSCHVENAGHPSGHRRLLARGGDVGAASHDSVGDAVLSRPSNFRSPLFGRLVRKLAVVGSAEFAEQITPYGYAHVVMELRGAGASLGSRQSRMMPDAVRDGRDVIDWIVAQPWSNGRRCDGHLGRGNNGHAAWALVTEISPVK